MGRATTAALTMAGATVDEVDLFDLYSCFPSAVAFARDALCLEPHDARPITVTGGLPYHGGPSSNYLGHSISHMAEQLRRRPHTMGLVTGIGMHMTKHVAAVWSATPGPLPVHQDSPRRQRWGGVSDTAEVDVVGDPTGSAVVRSATVVYRSDGSPVHAVAICELPDGRRCYARNDRADVIAAVADGSWVHAVATLSPTGDGTNRFDL